MIKLEYTAQPCPFGDLPDVLELKMTLGDNVTWDEATKEFHNFLRAAGYVIPYDFEAEEEEQERVRFYTQNSPQDEYESDIERELIDGYIDCSDPLDMDKGGSLGDRQPEWANRMHGPDKWWHQSNTEVASEDESNTDVAEVERLRAKKKQIGKTLTCQNCFHAVDPPEWVGLTDEDIEEVFTFPWHCIPFARAIEAKLKEKNA